MKIAMLTLKERAEKFSNPNDIPEGVELVYIGQDYTAADVIEKAGDAECIVVDAVLPVDAELIAGMPNLKLIHSEGVSYNRIDLEAANAMGIQVCNNRAVNAGQVAEQEVLLMLSVLRRFSEGDAMVRAGRQIEAKTAFIQEGLGDLIGKEVGLIGFGAIGKELTKRLSPFGCRVSYYDPFRASPETEEAYGVQYRSFEELLRGSDIVTIQVPVTPETTNIIRTETLKMMKPNAILINCARGLCVNSEDLANAIKGGVIYGCGLDTIDPEPVSKDDPILCLPEPYSWRVSVSPHIAGTTLSVFYTSYKWIWENVARLKNGEPLKNVVNG